MYIDNILIIKSKKNCYYIFDGLSNNIYEIGYEIDISDITETSIMNMLGYNSLLRNNPLLIEQNAVKYNVNKNAQTLIIELTERCNLRCTYCVFDDSNLIDRNHDNKSINGKIDFNEIDNFISRSNYDSFIVFYGGEPTLEFAKIKLIVDHVKKANDKIKFAITTNGYSLTNEMINFFILNDFIITISLDGNKSIHDSRRITINGGGTYEKILNNINKIKLFSKSFFEKNLLINCVINDEFQIKDINDFFSSLEINSESIRFSPEITKNKEINSSILKSIRKSINEGLNRNDFNLIDKEYFDLIYSKIEFRKTDDDAHLGKKICIPYSNRTYLRYDGSIQFCERIGDFNKNNSISDYLSLNIMNEFALLKSTDCSSCFAYNFCEFCPASFVDEGNLKNNKSKCDMFRESVSIVIEYYINEAVM